MKKTYVSVSTDPISNKTIKDIVKYAKEIQNSGADFLHCDIMDGDFVPTKTYDYNCLKEIELNTLIPLDVHLMVKKPWKQIKKYKKAGANILTIHYESFIKKKSFKEKLLKKTLMRIRKEKMLAGLTFIPKTDVNSILKFIAYCDLILVMSVEPGKSGQKFLENTYNKIRKLNQTRNNEYNFIIEVDGGINPEIAKNLIELGADIIVSGSYIFKSKNKKEAVYKLKKF